MDKTEWQGGVGDVWADEWQRTDRTFSEVEMYLEAAILARAPDTGRFVDIGSGAGTTSLAIASARPGAQIIGVDLSDALVAVATERGKSTSNASFAVGDAAQAIGQLAPVDLLYSRHGVMFFDDPIVAFSALHGAAMPGASLIFSCFRSPVENVWANETVLPTAGVPSSDPHAPGPFTFADPERVRAILTAAGWCDITSQPIDFAYHAGVGDDAVGDAVSYFGRIGPAARALRLASDDNRPAVLHHLRDACERHRVGNAVDFPAAAWIWSEIGRAHV